MIPDLDDEAALVAYVTERVHLDLALQARGVPVERRAAVLGRAVEVFTTDAAGAVVAREGCFSVRDPGEPLTLEEWLGPAR